MSGHTTGRVLRPAPVALLAFALAALAAGCLSQAQLAYQDKISGLGKRYNEIADEVEAFDKSVDSQVNAMNASVDQAASRPRT